MKHPNNISYPLIDNTADRKGGRGGRKKGHRSINMINHVRQKHHLLENMIPHESKTPVSTEGGKTFSFHVESHRSLEGNMKTPLLQKKRNNKRASCDSSWEASHSLGSGWGGWDGGFMGATRGQEGEGTRIGK